MTKRGLKSLWGRVTLYQPVFGANHRVVGALFVGIFLVSDLTTRQQRIAGRTADASDADAGVALGQMDWSKIFKEPESF